MELPAAGLCLICLKALSPKPVSAVIINATRLNRDLTDLHDYSISIRHFNPVNPATHGSYIKKSVI